MAKKPVAHRIKRIVPPIPDTPENVALAIMQGPPKKKWAFLKKAKTPTAEFNKSRT